MKKSRSRTSLSQRILIGLILGILTGLFLGEYAAHLAIIGRAYIGLLQMSILPYMVVSLMGGIGGLGYNKAKKLAITGGIVLVGSWFIAFTIVFVMPLAFPEMEAGSFFSPSMVEAPTVDFIDLYIPVNPFSSLSRTIVPASAVFSVIFGIALIGCQNKKPLLDVLATAQETLTRVAMMVIQLSPVGIFAIAANAAGTLSIADIGRLQVYIITFILASLILTFWILPGLTAILTPFTFRTILKSARPALITGFATGNLFIVLPMLIEQAKELFESTRLRTQDTDQFLTVLVPASFNFPNIGKLVTLLFVLFAGWFAGKEIPLGQYPMFSTLGLFTLFGGVDLALPFLLDQMRIPSDLYQLYVVTGVINGWFATLLAVMNLYTFTLIATAAATGSLGISWNRLARFGLISLIVMGITILGSRAVLSLLLSEQNLQQATVLQMRIDQPVETIVHKEIPAHTSSHSPPLPTMDQIIDRGVLRIGYNPGNLPFSFFNESGELVGYDIAMYHQLARDLGLKLEFIPWNYKTLVGQLRNGQFHLAAGGLLVNPQRLAKVAYSEPYMKVTLAIVIPDYLRNDFPTWEDVKRAGLKLGIPGKTFAKGFEHPLEGLEIIKLKSYAEFFQGKRPDLDGVVISAEAGSAWTTIRPEYSVAIPEPHLASPIAIATAFHNQPLLDFIDDWLVLQKTNGNLERLYDTWILGKGVKKKEPRWSILRNVLHWVD